MGIKRRDNSGAGTCFRIFKRAPDHRAMAEVHAVEDPDCQENRTWHLREFRHRTEDFHRNDKSLRAAQARDFGEAEHFLANRGGIAVF